MSRKLIKESDEFAGEDAELCEVCGEPTRYWLLEPDNVPLCDNSICLFGFLEMTGPCPKDKQ